MTKPLITPEEARKRFSRAGISVSAFAREIGVHPQSVWEVLGGRKKGLRGDSHKVAVVLGLKEGVITDKDMPIVEALKRAS